MLGNEDSLGFMGLLVQVVEEIRGTCYKVLGGIKSSHGLFPGILTK